MCDSFFGKIGILGFNFGKAVSVLVSAICFFSFPSSGLVNVLLEAPASCYSFRIQYPRPLLHDPSLFLPCQAREKTHRILNGIEGSVINLFVLESNNKRLSETAL
ncbi:MAG TPA: hypothetical protein DD671_06480, partial [Balneolaceae bacterium]|nr:hypothetical protein [Balneolaceae bacterium]